jgi:O-antigen ligase
MTSPENGRSNAFAFLVAEIVLVLHALTYSTLLYRLSAAITAAIGLLLASRVGPRRETLPIFLPLLAGGLVSLWSGAAPGPTVEALGVLLGARGWFLAGALEASRRPEERRLPPGALFAAAAVALAVAGLAHFLIFRVPPRLWMVSPIDFAIAVLLLGLLGRRAVRDRGVLPYTLVILACVAASTSRALILASIAVFTLDRRMLTRRGILIGSLILVAAAPFVWSRLSTDALAWNRTRIWAGGLNLVLERPWAGWGLGAYDAVSPRALLPDPLEVRGMRRPVHAHNEPLELIAEIGLPLGVAVIAAVLLFVAGSLRRAPVHVASPMIATLVIGLFYFPLRLVFPLFAAFFAAGGALPARRPGSGWPLALCAVPILVYALGIMLEDPRLAPFNARLAIESSQDETGVHRMMSLDPERPEAHVNLAMLAARQGESGGAVRGFEAAAGRVPGEHALRFELARACLWHARQVGDPQESVRHRAMGSRHLRILRILEPLSLAGHDAAGDTIGFMLADLRLDQLARRGEPERHIRLLRRRIEPELLAP